MSVIGELAAFVAGARAETLPAAEQERLRLHLTDTVVAALAGAHIAEGKALRSYGGERALADRIGRRAATIRLTEIDDIHLPSCTTPSAGVVPIALLLAAHRSAYDPVEIASAVWVGTEVMTRLGMAAAGPQILYRGIWPTYLAAPVSAAATAARLLALSETQTTHALSLAVMLTAGGVGRIHGTPSGRWFLYANAVAAGVSAAEAAGAGYRGDPELLEKNWFADTHGIVLDREQFTQNLGKGSVYRALSMKPVCSAKQGIAAIEAFRALLDSGIRRETITAVRVHVPPAYAGMIGTRAEPGARQSTMVSVAYQIALAAFVPQRLSDIDRSAPGVSPEVLQFAAKVEVVADAALETFYPRHWPAEVEIEAGGAISRRRVIEATGDPERPLGRAAIDDKAHRVLDPLLGAERTGAWLTLCHDAFAGADACKRLAAAFAAADRTAS